MVTRVDQPELEAALRKLVIDAVTGCNETEAHQGTRLHSGCERRRRAEPASECRRGHQRKNKAHGKHLRRMPRLLRCRWLCNATVLDVPQATEQQARIPD